jgi:hypothetical protein
MVTELKQPMSVEEEARREIEKEMQEKAKGLFKTKIRELETAKKVVAGLELQLDDLRRQLKEGTL